MEGNYQPGFYTTERDQQESRHQPSQPPQQQQQQQQQRQHAAHYPLDLPIPYHITSQHQSEFVVDQPLRAFPASHPVAPILHSIYQDSEPTCMIASSSVVQQACQQSPFTLAGHRVKPAILSGNYATPITTHEQDLGSNTAQPQGKTDITPAPSQQIQCKEQIEECPTSPTSPQQPNPSPPVQNTSILGPPLLAALNLKKSRAQSSSPELPRGLSFKVASQDKVEGVVAKETIEKGVEFGPYTGTLLDEDLGWSKDTTWEVCISGRVFFYIDGYNTWISNLRCAQSEEDQNMEAFQCYGEIYFRSTKVIEPGSELRVFYSKEYGKRVGIQTSLQDLKFNKDAQKFQCSLCEGLFSSAKLILRHIRCEHTTVKPDEMIPVLTWKKKRKKESEIEVSSKKQFITKNRASDQEVSVFRCGTCEKVFPSCGRLKAHEIFHNYSQDHTCHVCNKREVNAQNLSKHMMTHEPVLHKCNECNQRYKSKAALRKHKNEVHGYRCSFCLKQFPRKKDCKKHEQTHQAFKSSRSAAKTVASVEKTELSEPAPDEPMDMLGKTCNYYQKQRPYKCRFCPKRYSVHKRANDHEKEVHTGEGTFKCTHCPRVYTSECRLIDHLMSHEQNHLYRCTLCPRTFGSESALNNHQGEHTGLKPFKCEICGRGFRVKKAVHAHKRRMHQERPMRFFCSVCNKGFADKGNLTKHERRHKGIRQYVCLECGKGFTARTSLTAHMQTIHTAEKPFSCEICGKTFSLNHHFTYHMVKHKVQGDGNVL